MFPEDASTDWEELEATDPKFDDVKIITRSEEGKIITILINVSAMNLHVIFHYVCLIKL